MNGRFSLRAAVTILLAVVALAYPAATVAKLDPCAADRRVTNAWVGVLGKHVQLTAQQTRLLAQIVALLAADRDIPRELVQRLRELTAENKRVIDAGERRLVALQAGTRNGRVFKRLALRYLREVARPLNGCIADMIVADTRPETRAVVACMESTKRTQLALSRALDRAMTAMATSSRCRGR